MLKVFVNMFNAALDILYEYHPPRLIEFICYYFINNRFY